MWRPRGNRPHGWTGRPATLLSQWDRLHPVENDIESKVVDAFVFGISSLGLRP